MYSKEQIQKLQEKLNSCKDDNLKEVLQEKINQLKDKTVLK